MESERGVSSHNTFIIFFSMPVPATLLLVNELVYRGSGHIMQLFDGFCAVFIQTCVVYSKTEKHHLSLELTYLMSLRNCSIVPFLLEHLTSLSCLHILIIYCYQSLDHFNDASSQSTEAIVFFCVTLQAFFFNFIWLPKVTSFCVLPLSFENLMDSHFKNSCSSCICSMR